jgi:peptidoglycan-associated lipoprotein
MICSEKFLRGGAVIVALLFSACASTDKKTVNVGTAASLKPASGAAVAPSSNPSQSKAPMTGLQNQALAKSVYFEYDTSAIRDQSTPVLRGNAEQLVKGQQAIRVEGNCDERGSREYNMALGAKRAEAVKRALTVLGIKADRIEAISYGKERPKATGHDEASWEQNCRADIVSR